MESRLARFIDRSVSAAKEIVVGRPEPSYQPGAGGYATWVFMCLQCYKEREEETFRSVVDKLKVTPMVLEKLGLDPSEIPHPSTICNGLSRVTMALCRRLLNQTTTFHELGEVAAIDASGFDRIAASSRYTRKTDYRIQSLKTTLLVDCSSGAILDVHCSTNKPHDVPIGEQVLKRNLDRLSVVAADKGYDATFIRDMLQENGVRPLIKHREFGSIQKAHNARLDEDLYNRRQISESVFRVLGQSYSSSLNSRSWYRQFREITIKAAVKNIDDSIESCYA
jgi:IS5 family transposase